MSSSHAFGWISVRQAVSTFLKMAGLFTLAMLSGSPAEASTTIAEIIKPTDVFLQAGLGDSNTQSYTFGAVWNWHWQTQTSLGKIAGYSEASFGRWISTSPQAEAGTWATQLGVTPVLRQFIGSSGSCFVEIGIGANFIMPLYHSGRKQFSTQFNFGDHIAVGKQFGDHHREAVSLRFQHYSNAGINHPNPGENFLQLRYTHRF